MGVNPKVICYPRMFLNGRGILFSNFPEYYIRWAIKVGLVIPTTEESGERLGNLFWTTFGFYIKTNHRLQFGKILPDINSN